MSKHAKLHQPPEFAGSPGYVRAAQARRYSGAAGPHEDRRTRRHRTRGAARRHAIQEARR